MFTLMRLAWKKVRDRYRDAERNVPEAYKPQFMNLLAMMDFFIPIVYFAIVIDIQLL